MAASDVADALSSTRSHLEKEMPSVSFASVPEHFFYPLEEGIRTGAFERAGVRVSFKPTPEGTGKLVQMAKDGTVDCSVVLTEGAVAHIVKDADRTLAIAAPYVLSPLTWAVVTGGNSDSMPKSTRPPASASASPASASKPSGGGASAGPHHDSHVPRAGVSFEPAAGASASASASASDSVPCPPSTFTSTSSPSSAPLARESLAAAADSDILSRLSPPSVIGVSRLGSGSHLMSFVLMERETASPVAAGAASSEAGGPRADTEEKAATKGEAKLSCCNHRVELEEEWKPSDDLEEKKSAGGVMMTTSASGRLQSPQPHCSVEGAGQRSHAASSTHSPSEFDDPVDHAGLRFRICHNFAGLRRAVNTVPPAASCFMWETSMTQPYVDSGELRRLSTIDTPWPAFVVVARREWLGANREALKTAMEVLYRLCAEALSKPHAAATAAGLCERFHLSPSEARHWMSRVRFASSRQLPRHALTLAASALQRVGVLPAGDLTPEQIADQVIDDTLLELTDDE